MKIQNITIIISTILPTTTWGFTPSSKSSFTTSFTIQNHHRNTYANQYNLNQNHVHKIDNVIRSSRKSGCGGGSSTEMKMMFDQLANAITDVTRDIGGRKK